MTDVESNSLNLHYFSKRDGLADFVVGLLQGISKLFDTETKVTLLESRDQGHDHEVFHIKW